MSSRAPARSTMPRGPIWLTFQSAKRSPTAIHDAAFSPSARNRALARPDRSMTPASVIAGSCAAASESAAGKAAWTRRRPAVNNGRSLISRKSSSGRGSILGSTSAWVVRSAPGRPTPGGRAVAAIGDISKLTSSHASASSSASSELRDPGTPGRFSAIAQSPAGALAAIATNGSWLKSHRNLIRPMRFLNMNKQKKRRG